MTARAVFEASCHSALTKHTKAVAEGTWRPVADNALVDAILKAADRYALGADAARRREQVTARALDAALDKLMAEADTPAGRAAAVRAERTDIGRQPTYGTKAKAK